jgi:hypothetical protein
MDHYCPWAGGIFAQTRSDSSSRTAPRNQSNNCSCSKTFIQHVEFCFFFLLGASPEVSSSDRMHSSSTPAINIQVPQHGPRSRLNLYECFKTSVLCNLDASSYQYPTRGQSCGWFGMRLKGEKSSHSSCSTRNHSKYPMSRCNGYVFDDPWCKTYQTTTLAWCWRGRYYLGRVTYSEMNGGYH